MQGDCDLPSTFNSPGLCELFWGAASHSPLRCFSAPTTPQLSVLTFKKVGVLQPRPKSSAVPRLLKAGQGRIPKSLNSDQSTKMSRTFLITKWPKCPVELDRAPWHQGLGGKCTIPGPETLHPAGSEKQPSSSSCGRSSNTHLPFQSRRLCGPVAKELL